MVKTNTVIDMLTVQVRRAGSPPKRNVCSPLRRNNNKVTTQLSPSTSTPVRNIRTASPLRGSSPLKRANSPMKKVTTTPSRHKSPANIRRPKVVATPTTEGTTKVNDSASKEANLRLLSRSSMKKNRTSPTTKVDANDKSTVATDDISVTFDDMSLSSNEQKSSEIVKESDNAEVSPCTETWKDIYTPRNSHPAEKDDCKDTVQEDTVVRNIFPEEPPASVSSEKVEEEEEETKPKSLTGEANSDASSTKAKVVKKEATPRFMKEKATVEVKESKDSTSATPVRNGNRPSFMKSTTSSEIHIQHKGQKTTRVSDLKWEQRLRKNDNEIISRKVHSTFRERSSKYMRDSMIRGISVPTY